LVFHLNKQKIYEQIHSILQDENELKNTNIKWKIFTLILMRKNHQKS